MTYRRASQRRHASYPEGPGHPGALGYLVQILQMAYLELVNGLAWM
jgi:hypothetical protein